MGAAQETGTPEPVQIDPGTANSNIEKYVAPRYPEKAREMRVQGTVVLRLALTKKGKIKEMSAISGHPLLVPAAMDAVKQWKYRPYRVRGHAVEAWTEVVVDFKLQK